MALGINETVCTEATWKSASLYIRPLLLPVLKLKLYTVPLMEKYACE